MQKLGSFGSKVVGMLSRAAQENYKKDSINFAIFFCYAIDVALFFVVV